MPGRSVVVLLTVFLSIRLRVEGLDRDKRAEWEVGGVLCVGVPDVCCVLSLQGD